MKKQSIVSNSGSSLKTHCQTHGAYFAQVEQTGVDTYGYLASAHQLAIENAKSHIT